MTWCPRSCTSRFAVLALGAIGFVALACGWQEAPDAPTITAQGFDLAETREVSLQQAASWRLRIEAPAGLESLRVRERSYEVDLARSPEPSHFPLFGLPRRVWSKTDVTLDFGPYVAEKITSAGDYAFDILVTDRTQQTAIATLRIHVRSAVGTEPADAGGESSTPVTNRQGATSLEHKPAGSTPLRSGSFRLERVGRGPVLPGKDFGISWKTVESNRVIVRVVGTEDVASQFVHLEPGAFAGIDTRQQLTEAIESAEVRASIQIAAANNAAAGTEVAVVQPTATFLLRTDQSETGLSELGTTVTLVGRYKR